MKRIEKWAILLLALIGIGVLGCEEESDNIELNYSAVEEQFNGSIDLNNLENYAGQTVPTYITKDNTGANQITNEGATLGRVLFYDKNLSIDGTVSCASCHQQQFAFSDTDLVSSGVNGTTGRHSMRLVNTRFAEEEQFFWDERAATLEEQTTIPIRDHGEMGFSGLEGNPDFDSLISKLSNIDYYNELFEFVYGDEQITEERIQNALGQFIRSIQSFDSKYDQGRSQVNNDNQAFPNFTDQENAGKQLFLDPPPQGGAGCGGCHRAPEFDIDPRSLNNGVIGVAGNESESDLENTRAPSLRDLFNSSGELNGPLMHDGSFSTLEEVVEHYNRIEVLAENTNLDQRLIGPGNGQQLNLTSDEVGAIIAFLKTLSGNDIYTDYKLSDPFK